MLLSKKYSWCKTTSESTSSTRIQNASDEPWVFSSHWKSGEEEGQKEEQEEDEQEEDEEGKGKGKMEGRTE